MRWSTFGSTSSYDLGHFVACRSDDGNPLMPALDARCIGISAARHRPALEAAGSPPGVAVGSCADWPSRVTVMG